MKNTGDGLLAEFPSAVQAVRAAVQFQTRIKELTIGEAEDRRIAFRVGINIGDVIVESHDIFGDGVNIAARLESIAEPGGICISSSAYEHVRGKVGVEFADLGEQNLKNIARPVRAYAVVRDGLARRQRASARHAAHLQPPRLSIVVLPFANIGGDPEQDYFVDGVTESLTTDLSRISGSFVIARNTAFTFKGKAVDLKQVGRELNVRYVLEGSVQRGGNRLRVNVQLIDAETGNHLWAERFEKPVADLFDMQDEIVSRLANTLNAQLIEVEARRAVRSTASRRDGSLFPGLGLREQWDDCGIHDASACLFRPCLWPLIPAISRRWSVRRELKRRLGPTLSRDDWTAQFAAAEAAVTRALSLAPNHARAHSVLGFVQTHTNRAAQGIAECERALALDRNLADAHGFIGLAKHFLARGEETEAHIHEAFRLSPRDNNAYRWLMFVGIAKFSLGAKRSPGYAGASRPTEIIPFRIGFSPLHWRSSVHAMRRGPPRRQALCSIRPSPSAVT